jgi:hypothetical protein
LIVTIGRAAREDLDATECPERINASHCAHQVDDHTRVVEMRCCWCGRTWTEVRAQAYDHHGTYLPKAPPAREGRS